MARQRKHIETAPPQVCESSLPKREETESIFSSSVRADSISIQSLDLYEKIADKLLNTHRCRRHHHLGELIDTLELLQFPH